MSTCQTLTPTRDQSQPLPTWHPDEGGVSKEQREGRVPNACGAGLGVSAGPGGAASTYTLPERSSRASAPRATLQGREPEAETAAGVRAAAASPDTSPISDRPCHGSLRAGRGPTTNPAGHEAMASLRLTRVCVCAHTCAHVYARHTHVIWALWSTQSGVRNSRLLSAKTRTYTKIVYRRPAGHPCDPNWGNPSDCPVRTHLALKSRGL